MNSNLESRFLRLISLLSAVENIRGSDKIQKMVFILKKEGVPFKEKYKYYPIGPYSSDLQLEVRDLIERDIFEIDDDIPRTIKIKIQLEIADDPEISQRKGLINFLLGLNNIELEIVSTIYYLQDLGYCQENLIKKKIQILKPSLSEKISSGYQQYERIKENHFLEQ